MKSTNVRATPERLFSSPEARPTAQWFGRADGLVDFIHPTRWEIHRCSGHAGEVGRFRSARPPDGCRGPGHVDGLVDFIHPTRARMVYGESSGIGVRTGVPSLQLAGSAARLATSAKWGAGTARGRSGATASESKKGARPTWTFWVTPASPAAAKRSRSRAAEA